MPKLHAIGTCTAVVLGSLLVLGVAFARWSRPSSADEGKPVSKAPAAQSKRTFTKPSPDAIKRMLTPLQYEVTQKEGTEPPFHNEYWNNDRPGIYVDIVTGEPLFSSKDKFHSGTGWPSFTRPMVPANVVEKADHRLGVLRSEVRSKHGDSHLGHVFNDGPPPTGLRYCLDSAALRFIPADKLTAEGYGQFAKQFAK